MPIYPFRCTECDHVEEFIESIDQRDNPHFCPFCSSLMRRAIELQNVVIRGDIEPGFDESLGEYVGSRRELREKLAYRNAYNPDLMTNSEPKDGRLTKEERAIVEGRPMPERKTIFDRRQEPGWASESSELDDTGMSVVATEGNADYKEIIGYIKERSQNAARSRKNKT